MTPCMLLLFSEERLYVYKDRMIVTSRYFLYKKIRKYDVKDYKSIKCKFGGQFNGVGSTTTKSLSISLVYRGLDEFNKGELSLSSFFLWNIRDLNANNKNEIISKVVNVLTEMSNVTKLKIELDSFSQSWMKDRIEKHLLFNDG